MSTPQSSRSGSTAIEPPRMVPVFLSPPSVAAYGAPSVGEEVSWHLTFVASGDAGPGEDRGLVRLRVVAEPVPTVQPGAERAAQGDVPTQQDQDEAAEQASLDGEDFGREHHPVVLRAGEARLYWDSPSEVTGEQHVIGHVTASPDVPAGVPPTPCRVLDRPAEERRFVESGQTPADEEGFDPDSADGYVLVPGVPAVYSPVATSPARFGTLLVAGRTRTLETGVVATVDVLGIG